MTEIAIIMSSLKHCKPAGDTSWKRQPTALSMINHMTPGRPAVSTNRLLKLVDKAKQESYSLHKELLMLQICHKQKQFRFQQLKMRLKLNFEKLFGNILNRHYIDFEDV